MSGAKASSGRKKTRRGGTLLWAVAALAVAAVMTPLYVSACHSLTRLTARGGQRLIATQRGAAELDRLRTAGAAAQSREFAVAELPSGKGSVTLKPGPAAGLRKAEIRISWQDHGTTAVAEWTTLVGR
jgi:hypothetical protein